MLTISAMPICFICSTAPGGMFPPFILVVSISKRDFPSEKASLPGMVMVLPCIFISIFTLAVKLGFWLKSLVIASPKRGCGGPPMPPPARARRCGCCA